MSDQMEEFSLLGKPCVFLDDADKAIEVNEGRLLVPWCGVQTILIDRFDCRAHLQDLHQYESSDAPNQEEDLSDEELAIEKMCEFERYLELQVDIEEMATQKEEQGKRVSEQVRHEYGAVDFAYSDPVEMILTDATTENEESENAETEAVVPDPYICPPELKSLVGVQFPDTDKQAQIIERTAVFVARQGNQMEIVLKAKQTSNPLFAFLNYDNDLNPFYKDVVKLIRLGRYIPKARPKVEIQPEDTGPSKSIHEDVYELKLPKVDISNTAYASLINRFKKSNSMNRSPSPSPDETDNASAVVSPPESSSQPADLTSGPPATALADPQTTTNGSTPNAASDDANVTSKTVPLADSHKTVLSSEEYEKCYQDYYKHYYTHYYGQLCEQHCNTMGQAASTLSDSQQATLVDQSAKAAAIAASAAVNAIYQVKQVKPKPEVLSEDASISAGQRGIIEKMAEYVIRNGAEFEELVTQQKGRDPRFAFLRSEHPLHAYYLSRRRQLIADGVGPTEDDVNQSDSAPKTKTSENDAGDKTEEDAANPESPSAQDSPSRSKDLPSDRQSSISFKLTRPNSSTRCTDTVTAPSIPNSVYVHSSVVTGGSSVNASCPVLSKDYDSPDTPGTPPNSYASDDDKHTRSRSPVRFMIPGIPSASSSSASSTQSSRESSPVPALPSTVAAPKQTRFTTTPPLVTKHIINDHRSPTPPSPLPQLKRARKKRDASPSNSRLYPRSDMPCIPYRSPSPASSEARSESPVPAWNANTIEDMLDLGTVSPNNRSPSRKAKSRYGHQDHNYSHLHHQFEQKSDEQLRQERRQRAAKLVAKLQSGVSSVVDRSNGQASSHPSSVPTSESARSVSPPPAPNSVPAAVAHAVVASMKRRHEEAMALSAASTSEIETKPRRKHRSPPSAYAFPNNLPSRVKSPGSKHSRSSDSPVRVADRFDRDYSRDVPPMSKHSRSHKSKR